MSDKRMAPRRYLLPTDLPGALAHIDPDEFSTLLTAVIDEANRRGRRTQDFLASLMAANLSEAGPQKTYDASPGPKDQPKPAKGVRLASLTIGQTNAVRAAFKAGIKPSTIARQFGLSQSDVRAAITTGELPRKR